MIVGALNSHTATLGGMFAFALLLALGLTYRLALSGPRHRMVGASDPIWGERQQPEAGGSAALARENATVAMAYKLTQEAA